MVDVSESSLKDNTYYSRVKNKWDYNGNFYNALLVEPIASKYGSRGVVLTSARFHSDD